jgi:hypothetical protein
MVCSAPFSARSLSSHAGTLSFRIPTRRGVAGNCATVIVICRYAGDAGDRCREGPVRHGQQKLQKLNWRTSIVDLMKLVGMMQPGRSPELAKELHYTGDTNDSAAMNIWLHKQVMKKLSGERRKVLQDWPTSRAGGRTTGRVKGHGAPYAVAVYVCGATEAALNEFFVVPRTVSHARWDRPAFLAAFASIAACRGRAVPRLLPGLADGRQYGNDDRDALMLFVLQNSQIRDTKAINIKLDELLRALEGARTGLATAGELSEEELERIEGEFRDLAAQEPLDRPARQGDGAAGGAYNGVGPPA